MAQLQAHCSWASSMVWTSTPASLSCLATASSGGVLGWLVGRWRGSIEAKPIASSSYTSRVWGDVQGKVWDEIWISRITCQTLSLKHRAMFNHVRAFQHKKSTKKGSLGLFLLLKTQLLIVYIQRFNPLLPQRSLLPSDNVMIRFMLLHLGTPRSCLKAVQVFGTSRTLAGLRVKEYQEILNIYILYKYHPLH